MWVVCRQSHTGWRVWVLVTYDDWNQYYESDVVLSKLVEAESTATGDVRECIRRRIDDRKKQIRREVMQERAYAR